MSVVLVMLTMLVIAVPASAKPAPLTVGGWAIATYGDGSVQFQATGVTWTKPVTVQLIFTEYHSGGPETVVLETYAAPARGKVSPVDLINGSKLQLANVDGCTSMVSVRLVRADDSVPAEVMFPGYPRAGTCRS